MFVVYVHSSGVVSVEHATLLVARHDKGEELDVSSQRSLVVDNG